MGQRIDKEEILARTNRGLEVFRHYLGGDLQTNRHFRNPFYPDRRPSCVVYYDKGRDTHRFYDHGDSGYSGDCFWFVGRLYGLEIPRDFWKILAQVSRDMGLGLVREDEAPALTRVVNPAVGPLGGGGPTPPADGPRPYSVQEAPFGPVALAYWGEYGVGPGVLARYGVKNLTRFEGISSQGRPYSVRAGAGQLMFGYPGAEHLKVYRPGDPQMRFLCGGARPPGHIFGVDQLPAGCPSLFLTGGEKDVLSLAAHGVPAVSLNSETTTLPDDFSARLGGRFRYFFVLYDADGTGQREGAKRAAELRAQGLTARALRVPVPGEKGAKDVSDFFRLGGTRGGLLRELRDQLRGVSPLRAAEPGPTGKPRRGCRP